MMTLKDFSQLLKAPKREGIVEMSLDLLNIYGYLSI